MRLRIARAGGVLLATGSATLRWQRRANCCYDADERSGEMEMVVVGSISAQREPGSRCSRVEMPDSLQLTQMQPASEDPEAASA
ncbi:MAG: hypothetical protein R3F18_02310 [Lysobacterales bacterium]